jgi:CHAT domain-containing protein
MRLNVVAQLTVGLGFCLGGSPTRLPNSGPEAVAIARLYGAAPLLGAAATESAVRRQIEHTTVIHLATHGYLSATRAMDSGLLLTPPVPEAAVGQDGNDGVLQAWEIASQLKLQAELVVLSACETGRGRILRARGSSV